MPTPDDPNDEEVVQTAAAAAENVVFSRFSQSDIDDIDVTVTFEDAILEVDVYVNASGGTDDPERVVEDAVLAARAAVDDLLE